MSRLRDRLRGWWARICALWSDFWRDDKWSEEEAQRRWRYEMDVQELLRSMKQIRSDKAVPDDLLFSLEAMAGEALWHQAEVERLADECDRALDELLKTTDPVVAARLAGAIDSLAFRAVPVRKAASRISAASRSRRKEIGARSAEADAALSEITTAVRRTIFAAMDIKEAAKASAEHVEMLVRKESWKSV